jgi:hypothetical protein
MKPHARSTAVLITALVLTSGIQAAVDPPQPDIVFSKGASGTFAADWQGIANRVYFVQWSQDLVSWHYAPFIDFGDGMHSRGIENSTPKGFFRLYCGDYPGITSLDMAMNADFDGDGLSNIFEVTYGYDPFAKNSTSEGADESLDPDADGLGNASELAAGANPMVKDNPKVLLQVTEE